MEVESYTDTGSGRKRAPSQRASATKRRHSKGEEADQSTVDMAEASGLSSLEKRAKGPEPLPIGEVEALMIWESTLYQIAPVLGIEARVLSNGNVFLFMSERVGLCENCKHWRFKVDLDSVGICKGCH